MGGEKDGGAPIRLGPNDLAQACGTDRVLTRCRLVQEQKAGTVEQGPGQAQTHPHPLGESAQPLIGGIAKVDPVQQFDRVDHRTAVQRGKHLQVLPGGQAGEFGGQFKTHADLLVVVSAPLVQGSTEHTHVPLVSVQQTGQHALNGGLSRTGRAEEPEDLAGSHGEIHVLHRVLVCPAVAHVQS